MFEKTTRPFTSEEIQLLRRRIEASSPEYLQDNFTHDMYVAHGASLGCFAKLVVYIIVLLVALVVGVIIEGVHGVRGAWASSFLCAWFLCFLLIRIINMRLLRKYKSILRSAHQELERDLAEGYAVQWNFNTVKEALRIDYGEDFGYTLMMDVADDHTLFVYHPYGSISDEDIEDEQSDASNDQNEYDLLEELPNSKFSIVYTARRNFLIDVILFGERFSPSQDIEFLFDADVADELFLSLAKNIALFPVRLDIIRNDFPRWLETKFDPSQFVFVVVGY